MGYLNYVNTKMGTDSTMSFSRGNTLPLCQLPFSMCAFCPQTEIPKDFTWFYSPNKNYIEGIRLTHQPSPWIGDYGPLLFSTSSGEKQAFLSERLMPHHIKYELENGTAIEFAPSERGGAFKVSGGGVLSLHSVFGNTAFESKGSYIHITNDYTEKSDAKGFTQHTAIMLDGAKSISTQNGACYIEFDGTLTGRLAISYISEKQALCELGRVDDFSTTLENATRVWEKYLSKIEIDEENPTRLRVFYSCMYRSFLFPHMAYELDENGEPIHYSPFKGEVKRGFRYTDYGFWDTYRTSISLFSMVSRNDLKKMLEGFLNDYLESGYLPRWTSLGEVGCMPSTLIDGAIAEAVCQGVGSRELHKGLLEGMLHHATVSSKIERYGRKCLDTYLKYGYVPYTSTHESINLSLDFAYGDWCIAKVAESLGNNDIAKEYYSRADGYKKLFDSERGFFIAKDEKGAWRDAFDPFTWGYDYTESSAFQNIFGAPHALDEIAAMLGGKDKAIEKLDEIFNTPPEFKHGRYGCEIHEMTEMAKAPSGLGQCAISNQPSFSIPFLYAYYGNREKSDYYIKKITSECFTPDAYPGDEDNGSMSAWYIFAAIGKYPICPGSGKWVETTPLTKFKIKEE